MGKVFWIIVIVILAYLWIAKFSPEAKTDIVSGGSNLAAGTIQGAKDTVNSFSNNTASNTQNYPNS